MLFAGGREPGKVDRMTSLLRGLLGLATIAAASSVSAPVFAAATISFDPAVGTIEGVDTLSVHVAVDAGAVDLRGFSLVVGFDRTVVEIDTVYAGPQITGAACPHFFHWFQDATADSVAIDGATLGCSTAGPGHLATIVFRSLPRSPGDYPALSPLAWRLVDLRDSNNASLPTILQYGLIQVVEEVIPIAAPEPERETWGRTKSAFRAARGPQ
jgi:hypothetical protein